MDKAAAPDGDAIDLVVDHDVQDALRLTLPVRRDSGWSTQTLVLGPALHDVPTGCQPAIDADEAVRALCESGRAARGVTLGPLVDAWSTPEARDAPTLGRQVAAVLTALMRPWRDALWEPRFSTELCEQPWFAAELRALLEDAPEMAAAYNRAAAAVPEAGVAWLGRGREWVELPVWRLEWNRPRRRVFADVSDAVPWLVGEDGQRLDWEADGLGRDGVWLAPKALWMTALIRRQRDRCAGFVHGTGGAVYDRAMERWWAEWRGEALAPKSSATADATLPLPGPVADRAERARAIWFEHHLPHNLDRVAEVAAAHPDLVAEKNGLLAGMRDERDRRRRRAAFDRLHTINAALADAHHVLLDRAARDRQRAEVGRANAALRRKRDWCFALYPEATLNALRDAVHSALLAEGAPHASA
ncbi:MAG: hypothetical protein AAGE65_10295 [Planctomycetota bacterium]